MLWEYRTTTKKLHKQTQFQLVYGREVLVSLQIMIPSIYITCATNMTELMELEESCI